MEKWIGLQQGQICIDTINTQLWSLLWIQFWYLKQVFGVIIISVPTSLFLDGFQKEILCIYLKKWQFSIISWGNPLRYPCLKIDSRHDVISIVLSEWGFPKMVGVSPANFYHEKDLFLWQSTQECIKIGDILGFGTF